jgi:hypothetical protein
MDLETLMLMNLANHLADGSEAQLADGSGNSPG